MGVMDNGREWSCSVVVYDLVFGDPTQNNSITAGNSTTYTNTNIKNWKITDTMSANGDVAFGSTGSKALNLELIGLASKSFGTGAIIGVTLTLTGGSSSSWFFFVDEVKWTADFGTTTTYGATVTAYDAMYYANNKISSVTLPSSIQSDISDGKASITSCKTIAQYCIRHARYDLIRTRAEELYAETELAKYNTYASMYDSNIDDGWTSGKTMDDVCANSTGKANVNSLTGVNNISITTSITGRTLLGRMAAMKGKRAYCNNNSLSNVGKIDWDSLISSNYGLIQKKDVYENGFKAEGKKKFTYFKSGTSSSPATYGKKSSSGLSTMAIDCPDMNNSILANIASPFKNTEYEIGSVKFRGDPSLKAGMSASIPDASGTTHDVIATKVVSQYDGGFYQQIYSEGKSDSDIEFENNSYDEKAEEIVDDGGGGSGTSLLYYTETETPDTATIEVGSNSIEVNTTAIDITGNINATGDFVSNATGGWYAKVEASNGVEIGSNNYNVLFTNNGVGMTKGASYRYPFPTANILLTGNVYSADGIIGAKCLQSQYLYGHNIGFVDKFGLASQNSGTYDNPALRWYLRPQGGDKTQLINAADVDHTFDLRSLNTAGQPTGDTITIKTNDFEAKNITSDDGYVYCDRFYSNAKDINDTRCVLLTFSNANSYSSPYCQAEITVGTDKIVIQHANYGTLTGNKIVINLTATNINDLFTFL